MKISISITSVIDDICADSAIRAIFNRRDTVPPLLTGDHCEALGRVVVTAAAMTAGRLAARLTKFAVSEADGTIGFEVADTTRVRMYSEYTASPMNANAVGVSLSSAFFSTVILYPYRANKSSKQSSIFRSVYYIDSDIKLLL